MANRITCDEIVELAEMVLGTTVSYNLCGADVAELRDWVDHYHAVGGRRCAAVCARIESLVDMATAPRARVKGEC